LEIKKDEHLLEELKRRVNPVSIDKIKDVFISHASEDKDFARPLAEGLRKSGLSVWYDEYALTVGDGLRSKIDEGLAHSTYGIVILSKSFFAKNWPQQELGGLFSKEISGTGNLTR